MGECLITRRGGETYKPAILDAGYPQNVTKTVIKGSTTSAAFRVLVAEAGNPASYTYQWYKDGVAVSGATGASYTITGLGETATHTVYCEVTNKGGVATSRIATLKVTQQYTPVLNSSYPANVTGAEIGGSATFKVTIATAGYPASYTYQWYVNDSAVSGATSASYTRSGLAKGSYTVYCKVTNAAGTVQSRTATLTVTQEYLYSAGDTNTGFIAKALAFYSGGDGTTPSITYGSSNVVFKLNDGWGKAGVVYFPTKKDLTGITQLKASATLSGTTNPNSRPEGLYVWSAISAPWSNTNVAGSARFNGTGTKELTIDVSNLTGEYYIGFGLRGENEPFQSITLTEVVLS